MKYYAGIGSRKVPLNIELLMYDIGSHLGKSWILRSGHALGSDLAFENGADSVNPKGSKNHKEIFVAEDATPEAIKLAKKYHPKWSACDTYTRKLHGRNCMIILGKDLKTPVEYVVFWAEEDQLTREVSGGTSQGIRIARHHGIKVFNLYFEDVKKKFTDKIYFGK